MTLEKEGDEPPGAWLERGAGRTGEMATSIPSEQVRIAALVSLAITAKRVVDMLEPFAEMAHQQLKAEIAAEKKGKGR